MRCAKDMTMKTIKTLFYGAVMALLFTAGMAIGHGQTFSSEVRISNQAGPSLAPTIVAAGSNLYVVWSENISNGVGGFDGEIYVRVSNNNGTSWNTAINISNAPSRQDIDPIVAASGANVVVFWTDSQQSGDVYYSYSTNSGASFSAPTKVTNTSGYSRPGGALIDSGGRVFLAYYDNTTTNYGQIFYQCSSSVGAGFGAAVNVLAYDGVVDNGTPRLQQAADGTIFMLYQTSRNGLPQGGWPPFDQYLLRTSPAQNSCTLNWLFPSQKVSRGLPEELVTTYGGNIAVGNADALHAAWWNDKAGANLYYRKGAPNGVGWNAPVDVTRFGANHLQWDGTAAEMSDFGMGEDTSNDVHFVFADRTSTYDGYMTGNLYYTCIDASGALQAKISAKTTGSANAMQPRGIVSNGLFHMVWSDFRDAAAAITTGAEIYYRNVAVGTCSITAAPQAGVSVSSVDFGGQSTGTTAPAKTVTVTNIGTGTLTVSGVSVDNAQFAQTNNCGSVGAGASCTINVTFSPATISGAINSTAPVSGTLSIANNGAGGTSNVALTGTAEKSLVTHYYRSILRRAPDGGGKTYWESEAVRMQSSGVNVNETWYAMAMYFYFSPEYLGFNRDDAGFVTDLYNTFFNRAPDGGGISYWTGQIAAGMPREVVLAGFMFSSEFVTFTQGIFGNTAARAEVDTVMDFYRGMLSRLPDAGGLTAWVQQFRTAQCTGSTAVYQSVESISSSFANGAEYTGKGRTNAQYVGDLYNAFMRRGGDLTGVQYWIDQLNTAARTRNKVRQDFITTPEFAARVSSIIAYGCLP